MVNDNPQPGMVERPCRSGPSPATAGPRAWAEGPDGCQVERSKFCKHHQTNINLCGWTFKMLQIPSNMRRWTSKILHTACKENKSKQNRRKQKNRKNSKNIRTKQHKIIANRRELDLAPVFEPAISRLVTAQRIFHVDLGYAKIHPSIFIHNPRKFRSRPSTLYKHAISDMWAFPRQILLSLRFFPIILTIFYLSHPIPINLHVI